VGKSAAAGSIELGLSGLGANREKKRCIIRDVVAGAA
jgi:hypothetical protein